MREDKDSGMKRTFQKLRQGLLGVMAACVVATPVYAKSLRDSLVELSKNHKQVLAANADVAAAEENIDVSRGDWFPSLDFTANIGHQRQQKPTGAADTHYVPRHLETTINQKLWDFGSVNAAIRQANLTYQQSVATRDAALQTVLLDGLSAYLNVVRTYKLLNFARDSADNIKRQLELEDAKVQRGSGLSTDVLQAKTQLAGALARVIQSEGALKTALNRYRAVFGKNPEDVAKMVEPRLPLEMLPKSLEDTITEVRENNPQLKASRLSAAIAHENVLKTRADSFLPKFNVVGEHKIKEDSGGSLGSQQEWQVKLEGKYNLNLGLTAINTLRAARQTHIATVNRFGDTRDMTEEQTRNAWDNLKTARANAEHLHNQADIAAESLDLARKERELGNRSLIDVLSGETALINASSDAASADTDVAIAVFTLLNVMGRVDPKNID